MNEPKISVLLVDDETDFLDVLARRLSRRGIEVRAATGGREALAMLQEAPAQVVILDVKMPEMDGIETLQEILSHHPGTEVIMLTGHADVDLAFHGLELGAFDYLLKPTDLDDLLYKLHDAADRKGRTADPAAP